MTGLCIVPLQILDRPYKKTNHLNQVNGKKNSILYLHAAAFSPVQDTWAKSVNRGYFKTWPELTEKDIQNITKYESTVKGHLV